MGGTEASEVTGSTYAKAPSYAVGSHGQLCIPCEHSHETHDECHGMCCNNSQELIKAHSLRITREFLKYFGARASNPHRKRVDPTCSD